MNVPNKLTVLRMGLVPIFMIVFMIESIPYHNALAAIIFIFASATDWLDGYLARKNNLVTNFGKFMDPLADKLLVTGALLCLMEQDAVAFWVVMIIIAREFIVSGLRLVAVTKGIVIAAGQLGKPIIDYLIYLSVFLTVFSGVDYLIRNKNVFLDE